MTKPSKVKRQEENRNSKAEAAKADETASHAVTDPGKPQGNSPATGSFRKVLCSPPTLIALAALLVSGYTCWRDNQRYNETTKPLAQSEQAERSLDALDSAITSYQALLKSSDNVSGVIGDLPAAIDKALSLKAQASVELALENYSLVLRYTGEGSEDIKAAIASEAETDVGSAGNITITATGGSLDAQGWAEVSSENGTTATTKEGKPLDSISWTVYVDMRPVPSNAVRVLELDAQPSGATFSQPITITFHYLASSVPQWYLEEDLVIEAWNDTNNKWESLHSSVDTSAHAIKTSAVSRLTTFAVLAISPGS